MRRWTLLGVLAVALFAVWASCASDTDVAPERSAGTSTVDAADDPATATHPERARVEPPAPEPEEPFVLPPLVVRVTLPGGAPLADAEIQVCAAPPVWSLPPEVVTTARTGTDGSVSIPLLPGNWEVRGVHADVQVLGAEVAYPADCEAVLRAGAGPRLVLTVVDAEGDPIAGAVCWERHSLAGRVGLTDETGRADLGRVYPFNPYVHVEAEGRAGWSNYVFGAWDGADVVERRITLRERTLPVVVRVLEHDGEPASGVRVAYKGGLTATGPDGRATLRLKGSGGRAWARAEAADGREIRVTLGDAAVGGAPVELRLPPPHPLPVRVVHAWTGDPVERARVLIQRDTEWIDAGETDAEGRLVVPHGDPDDAQLVAFAPGLAPSGDEWTDDVEPDDDGDFVLRLAPTMRISGRAVNEDGEPVAGARVEALHYGDAPPLGAETPATTTAADGTFTLTGVPAVPRMLAIVDDGRGIGWSDIDGEIPPTPDGAFDVGDVVVPRGFDLDVPVIDDDGAPLASGVVWVRWRIVSHGTPSEHRLVLDGRMDPVRGIPRGYAVAEIESPDCLKTVVRIDAGTTALVADRPCTARGRLVRATTAEPVAGVVVTAESTERLSTLEGNHAGAKTRDDGSFELAGLRRGRYRFRALTDRDTRLAPRIDEIDVTSREVDLGTISVD